jgi:4-hydroxy-3-polyprenylbenzoate decarboxylase
MNVNHYAEVNDGNFANGEQYLCNMSYSSLEACLLDLGRTGQLIRIQEEVDPHLEMAAIHMRVYAAGGPALLFERVKGSRFRAASNIFGTIERSRFIFRHQLAAVEQVIRLKNDPMAALRDPLGNISAGLAAMKALPLRNPLSKPVLHQEINISDIPQIQHWPMDGGAFVTLPQVYSEDPDRPGIMRSNLGMYRVQLSGNKYEQDREIGLHYQLHRGIGVHQTKANGHGQPLKVSVFAGGPPAHTLAAVMPLPEGLSEMTFAGLLGGRRFRYTYRDGFCVSTDADFVITGEIHPGEVKPEGPFGDHLGYYSLQHPFPLMRVHKVYARKDAIWPFTVVGRPPQEDTSFGQLIHEMTGDAIPNEIPGVKEVHAVDAAGVHPLLLAIGSERYTPFMPVKRPAELMTIASHILGTGQLSLAKYLFITSDPSNQLSTHRVDEYLQFVLERLDLRRDLHFITETTIDTLDYSGTGLNIGSKVVLAAYGDPVRTLNTEVAPALRSIPGLQQVSLVMPGVVAVTTRKFTTLADAAMEADAWQEALREAIPSLQGTPMIVWCDDAAFTAASLNNFLWVTFTRSNPSTDMYGIGAFTRHKHWGSEGPVIIDARVKPHHAPALVPDAGVEKRVDRFFAKGGCLGKWG